MIAMGFYHVYKSPTDEQDVIAAIVWPSAVGMLLANELNKTEIKP